MNSPAGDTVLRSLHRPLKMPESDDNGYSKQRTFESSFNMAFNGDGPMVKRQRTDIDSGPHRVSCQVLKHNVSL